MLNAQCSMKHLIPHGLMARILGFHPRGPGSIPGVGDHIFFKNENFLQIGHRFEIHRMGSNFLFFYLPCPTFSLSSFSYIMHKPLHHLTRKRILTLYIFLSNPESALLYASLALQYYYNRPFNLHLDF